MIEALKMAARVTALVTGFTLIVVLMAVIKVPTIDFSGITSIIGTGLAVFTHWIPGASLIWTFIKTLVGVTIALFAVVTAFLGVKWALKISEG